MKKSIFTAAIMLSTLTLFAQWQTSAGGIYYNAGFVGIGKLPTTRPLEVNGFARTYYDLDENKFLQFGHGGNNGYMFSNSGRFDFRVGATFAPENSVLSVTQDKRVGILTFNPQSELSVNGKIECEEAQVVVDVVPDYVFKEDYSLMPLEELESFISSNGHLPNVQNQEDVDNNRGLVKLGELSISLLEKVEELTLHVIELNKRLKDLEQENAVLKEKE